MKLRNAKRLATGPVLALITLVLCLCSLIIRVDAQTATTTSITGTVTDPTGAAISGASVSLKNQNTGSKADTKTGPTGDYAFLDIRPGIYTVTVSFQGFQTTQITDRTIDIGSPAHVDAVLSVGASAQTVTVSAKGAELLNTASAEVSGTLNATLVANLPIASQDFLALASVTPGANPEDALGTWQNNGSLQVSTQQHDLGWNPVGGTSIVGGVIAGGQRGEAGSVSIDGSNVQSSDSQLVTQMQSPSSIQEVKVESGIMNSEFGYGVFAVNVSTKGGTNSLHGEVFDYLRNSALDANDFYTNLAGAKLPPYRQNEFGAAVGGPILRNKLHFFANYAGKRAWQGTSVNSPVPSAAMRNGDFNDIGHYDSSGNPLPAPQIYNPYQVDPGTGERLPFVGNVIPTGATSLCAPEPTCIDPASLAMLKYTPLPNGIIDGNANYVSTNVTQIQQDQGTGRIDWDTSAVSRVYARYTDFRNYNIASGALPLQGLTNPFSSKNIAASWTRTLGPSMVNEFWASYTRPRTFTTRDTSAGDVSKEIGLVNTSSLGGSPNLQVPGYQLAFSLLQYNGNLENTYQLKDNFSMVRGTHSIKFGFQGLQRRYDVIGQAQDKGQFIWGKLYTNACAAGNATCNANVPMDAQGGLEFADYLLGTAAQEGLSLSGSDTHQNMSYYGGYVQDSWRATSKLTVNYGLRYEYWAPWHVTRNNVVGYNKFTGVLSYALQNPLDFFDPSTHYGRDAQLNPNFPKTLYSTGKLDFAPRLGLAYLLGANTVVRAGAGIFFDGSSGNNTVPLGGGIGPFGYTLENIATGNEALPPYLFRNAFPAPATTGPVGPSLSSPPSFGVLDDSSPYKTPTTYEWSFSIQRKLGSTWGLEATYFGFHAIRNPQAESYNPANLPNGPDDTSTPQERRLYPQWGQLTGSVNAGWAKYNAFTATVKSNNWHGLTTLSTFTWSKDKVTEAYGIANQGMMDYRHLYDWAGPSLINPDLRFVSSWTYELPVGKNKRFSTNGPVDYLIGGWRFTGIAQFMQGGHQWFLGQDNSGTALATYYGMDNLVCNPNIVPGGKTRLLHFNPACYQTAPYGQFGNADIGSFIEPGLNNWDLSVARTIRIPAGKREVSNLDFRADFFNAFNHAQFAFACNQFNCGPYVAQSFSTHNPRQVQFVLQYQF